MAAYTAEVIGSQRLAHRREKTPATPATTTGGVTTIETAAQAASALRPIAGDFAFLLFALGILGVGMIGVPVLAGSAAYAMAEAMDWKGGLERKEAPLFASKVALADPKTGKPTRVRFETKDGKKVRVAVKSGETING